MQPHAWPAGILPFGAALGATVRVETARLVFQEYTSVAGPPPARNAPLILIACLYVERAGRNITHISS